MYGNAGNATVCTRMRGLAVCSVSVLSLLPYHLDSRVLGLSWLSQLYRIVF